MFKILEAEQLSANVYKQVILAPRVAKSCEPGQFIILRVDEHGERIPLTICDYDREAGTVTIVFQPIGVSTNKLVALKAGDSIADFVGPLGHPSDLVTDDFEEVKKKKVVFIAGGVGTAPVYPQAKWLHEHGIECDIIVGARTKDILIMEEEMSKVGNLYLCTDDGSYGFKGVGTAMLEKLVSEGHHYDLCVAIGPMIMMKFACLTTKKLHLRSIIYELLWFLKGETNIKFLKDNGVSIWDEWADENGDLGHIYGYQWRSWPDYNGSHIDQITEAVETIKHNPDSRRIIVSAWNVADLPQMNLPPCHAFFQFYVANGRLSLQLYQRSADIFLGVPFNIASYALLLQMMAQVTGLKAGDFVHTLGDAHIYSNHIEQVKLQLTRTPRPLPQMKINSNVKDIFGFKYEDFILTGYDPHPHIKGEVAV